MGKLIPLTKNHKTYENIPEGLRWAIPIHEAVSRPEVKRQAKFLEALVDQRLEREEIENRKLAISLVPTPGVSSDTSS